MSSHADGDNTEGLHVVQLSTLRKYDEPFECTYCHAIVAAKRQRSYKKHVYADLRAYICTFEDCNTGLFEDRDTWWQHEMNVHRRQWSCQSCQGKTFDTAAALQKYLRVAHDAAALHDHLLAQIATASSIPVVEIAASECPLCEQFDLDVRQEAVRMHTPVPSYHQVRISLKRFQQHLAYHLEQLALFAVPPQIDGNIESGSKHSREGLVGADREQATLNWQDHLRSDQGPIENHISGSYEHNEDDEEILAEGLGLGIDRQRGRAIPAQDHVEETVLDEHAGLSVKSNITQAVLSNNGIATVEALIRAVNPTFGVHIDQAIAPPQLSVLRSFASLAHVAIQLDCRDSFVPLVADRRVDLDMRDGRGYNTLHCAASFGQVFYVESLLQHRKQHIDVNVHAYQQNSNRQLQWQTSNRFGKLNSPTLGQGSDQSTDDHEDHVDGQTALSIATERGSLEIMDVLLKHGANPDGSTCLLTAVLAQKVQAATLLIEHGADVNVSCKGYVSLLAAAASRGNVDLMRLLLDNGAHIDAVGSTADDLAYGTPLVTAIVRASTEAVALLIRRGANVRLAGPRGDPLSVAKAEETANPSTAEIYRSIIKMLEMAASGEVSRRSIKSNHGAGATDDLNIELAAADTIRSRAKGEGILNRKSIAKTLLSTVTRRMELHAGHSLSNSQRFGLQITSATSLRKFEQLLEQRESRLATVLSRSFMTFGQRSRAPLGALSDHDRTLGRVIEVLYSAIAATLQSDLAAHSTATMRSQHLEALVRSNADPALSLFETELLRQGWEVTHVDVVIRLRQERGFGYNLPMSAWKAVQPVDLDGLEHIVATTADMQSPDSDQALALAVMTGKQEFVTALLSGSSGGANPDCVVDDNHVLGADPALMVQHGQTPMTLLLDEEPAEQRLDMFRLLREYKARLDDTSFGTGRKKRLTWYLEKSATQSLGATTRDATQSPTRWQADSSRHDEDAVSSSSNATDGDLRRRGLDTQTPADGAAESRVIGGLDSESIALVATEPDVDEWPSSNAEPNVLVSTELWFAATKAGNVFRVQIYLQEGIDVSVTDQMSYTALHHAAAHGDIDLVPVLLQAGADLDAKIELGDTPLHLAAAAGHLSAVKELVGAGADINAKNMARHTALFLALQRLLPETRSVAEYLLHLGANTRMTKSLDVVHALIGNRTNKGPSRMMDGLAADMLTMLLDHDSGLQYTKDMFGRTALHTCVQTLQQAMAERLLARGTEVGAKADDDMTPMQLLCALSSTWESRRADMFRLLVEYGADYDPSVLTADTEHLFGTLSSKMLGHPSIVVDRSQLTEEDSDPAERAAPADVEHVADPQRIKSRRPTPEPTVVATDVFEAIDMGDWHRLGKLLDVGGDPDTFGAAGEPALHRAAERQDVKVLQVLLNGRANTNIRHDQGQTALHRAV
ncbi:hypothetical protein B0A48_00538 [Cryoendolithus antarcticus]|uniref:Oxidoreductase acuF-like C2H2 type zinc-finger domain-containing protein n=1 Tax=Cryoendolithus antarcticus TaxID=1507870 RepID=A0A1V8TV00_9PEZI|nr:hypothetical protein B0A48_00538 [Cryoendolithus antarcticus]